MEKNTIKYIKSLQQKKCRIAENRFVTEGIKSVNELLASDFEVETIYATDTNELDETPVGLEKITEKELGRISSLKNPNKVLAVAKIPDRTKQPENIDQKLSLVLENVQDPGNMGTIIRLADWYGIEHIFCSEGTVECYNPKVVQAAMGAIFRIKIHYLNIYDLITDATSWNNFGVFATHLDGKSIYRSNLHQSGLIVMGNESKGLSSKVFATGVKKIKLPSYPQEEVAMESLNVAVATAITVAEFRRRQLSEG